MSTLLKAPIRAKRNNGKPTRWRMTEEEFDNWHDELVRGEWVNGEVITMSPANVEHLDLGAFIDRVMGLFVAEHNLGKVIPELQVRLNLGKKIVRRVPDVVFITRERLNILTATYAEGAPDLVIEIVSPDSTKRDWREKLQEYEAAGVREYWVVDPLSKQVEVYALSAKRYQVLPEKGGAVHSRVLPGFFLKQAWLFQDPRPNPRAVLKELGIR